MLKQSMAALAALSLAAAPAIAQTAPVAPVAGIERVGAETDGEQLRGGFILPLVGIVAIVIAIILLTRDNDDDLPTSP
jgi:hypothetical protein